ncbi:MAG: COX15/CtaA family protein [Rhodospirillales bacterium]|nr:COX15/CtaA family protein [Rhodospirillales bacterium]MDE1883039.1 COX15/CtaA family protein [Rhodospirillales bacterium]MDE2459272.1 COX15/CtaA family protein [Rhodospirillales bacterium]
MPSQSASQASQPFDAAPPANAAASPANRRLVAGWLFLLAFMIWVMVGIGGYTRDSGSGLSIMRWEPIIGVLPPMSQSAWAKLFALYKTIPQYQILHPGMGLHGFKQLFWPEYFHRLWGRLMGVVLLLPLVVFAITGRIEKRLVPWLVLLFFLGGLQGLIGWLMVSSGFDPDSTAVAPGWLSLHFFGAMFLFSAVLWTAFTVTAPEPARYAGFKGLRGHSIGSFVMLLLAMLGGTIVSGIHGIADFSVAKQIGTGQPPAGWPAGLFTNPATVIFDHQGLAVLASFAILAITVRVLRREAPPPVRDAALLAGGLVVLQFVLGVTALVSGKIDLGVVHQMNAVLLMGAMLLLIHRLRGATR